MTSLKKMEQQLCGSVYKHKYHQDETLDIRGGSVGVIHTTGTTGTDRIGIRATMLCEGESFLATALKFTRADLRRPMPE